jgi:spermidine/putrescine transport system permease protein
MASADFHPFVLLLPFLVVAVFLAMGLYEQRKVKGPSFWKRNGPAVSLFLIVAVGFWALFLIVLPQIFMIELSFRPNLPPMQMGGPRDIYTLANYRYFLFGSTTDTSHWNSTHLYAFFITIFASVVVTLVNFALCYPLAFYLAQVATVARVRFLMLLLIAPYWINEVLRAFAFRVIFASSGVLNRALMGLGITGSPVDFLGADVGLYVGLSYAYLLLLVFPLYNAIESLDRRQIEAARDLGAPWWHIHAFIVIPHAKPGIASGCTLVFMLTSGALAAPLVLSGPRTLWFTPIVYNRFYQAFNWPQGSAYAFLLLLACIGFVLLVLRATKLSLGEMTK